MNRTRRLGASTALRSTLSDRAPALAQSGWLVRRAHPARNLLSAVAALDAETAIAVGVPRDCDLQRRARHAWNCLFASFVDAHTGTTVGENGLILRTETGGE